MNAAATYEPNEPNAKDTNRSYPKLSRFYDLAHSDPEQFARTIKSVGIAMWACGALAILCLAATSTFWFDLNQSYPLRASMNFLAPFTSGITGCLFVRRRQLKRIQKEVKEDAN